MKRVKIDLNDLMVVLEAMKENGTTEIVFFEHGNLPAISDAADMDSVITFQTFDPEQEDKDGNIKH